MNDGNSAALSAHENNQDALEARHAAYGEQAVESIVDDLFRGKGLIRYTIHDFCEDITHDDIGAMLITRELDDIDKKVRENIKNWCNGGGADLVAERERELDLGE